MFNQFVKSRENAKHTGGDIHILFCHEGILGPGEVFQPNHKFVVAGHALGHTFGHALHFLFDYPFQNPRSAPASLHKHKKIEQRRWPSFQTISRLTLDSYTEKIKHSPGNTKLYYLNIPTDRVNIQE